MTRVPAYSCISCIDRIAYTPDLLNMPSGLKMKMTRVTWPMQPTSCANGKKLHSLSATVIATQFTKISNISPLAATDSLSQSRRLGAYVYVGFSSSTDFPRKLLHTVYKKSFMHLSYKPNLPLKQPFMLIDHFLPERQKWILFRFLTFLQDKHV